MFIRLATDGYNFIIAIIDWYSQYFTCELNVYKYNFHFLIFNSSNRMLSFETIKLCRFALKINFLKKGAAFIICLDGKLIGFTKKHCQGIQTFNFLFWKTQQTRTWNNRGTNLRWRPRSVTRWIIFLFNIRPLPAIKIWSTEKILPHQFRFYPKN